MNRVLEFVIRAKDGVSSTLNTISGKYQQWAQQMRGQRGGGGATPGGFSLKTEAAEAQAAGETITGVFGQISAGAVAVGLAIKAAFATKAIMDWAGELKDAADASGLNAEKFQALAAIAKTNGVEVGTLTQQMMKLRDAQSSIDDNPKAASAFNKLGITVAEVKALSPEDLLMRVAKGLKDTGDSAAATDIFGRGAARMITSLNELANGWENAQAKMSTSIVDEAALNRIDSAGDKIDMLGVKIKAGFAKYLVDPVASLITAEDNFNKNAAEGMEIKPKVAPVVDEAAMEKIAERNKKAQEELAQKRRQNLEDTQTPEEKLKRYDQEAAAIVADTGKTSLEIELAIYDIDQKRNALLKQMREEQKRADAEKLKAAEKLRKEADDAIKTANERAKDSARAAAEARDRVRDAKANVARGEIDKLEDKRSEMEQKRDTARAKADELMGYWERGQEGRRDLRDKERAEKRMEEEKKRVEKLARHARAERARGEKLNSKEELAIRLSDQWRDAAMADKALVNIDKSTQDLAAKIEKLLALKET